MAAKRSSAKPAPKATIPPKPPSAPPADADPRVAQIKHLIDVMVASGAVEVEMEEAGKKLRVRLKEDRPIVTAPPAYGVAPQAPAVPVQPALGGPVPAAHHSKEAAHKKAEAAEEVEGEVFKSPMVGTFYSSPSPEAEPFVRVGDKVKAEQTVCIIEAMKVMNEIKAEKAVTILKVLAQNGEPVEFGQPLFLVRA